jgi:tetratricopeptide (TPR) repeat protein
MKYLLAVVAMILGLVFFQARAVVGLTLCQADMRTGDYDGALSTLHWASLGVPNVAILQAEALTLALAGRTADAEPLYRAALGMVKDDPSYPRERIEASLGYALVDLARYDEAEQCFHRAIEEGDKTGNSEAGLSELRLVQGVEAEQALAYASQAIEHWKQRGDEPVPKTYYLHQAWAMALLGRTPEARELLGQATGDDESEALAAGNAELHWVAGMVLLQMQQTDDARTRFQTGYDVDPNGKYGRLCQARLRGPA